MATVAVAVVVSAPAADPSRAPTAESAPGARCRQPVVSSGYVRRVERALRSKEDVWGRTLLEQPNGPTYESASRYLPPLLLARAAKGRPLTASGVHYVPFTEPDGAWGATSVALHVADGSQIISERTSGRSLTIGVGTRGLERYGSCLARLASPTLANGYLPILETRYVDGTGVRYRQESFAARIPETRSLVSFVRLSADAGRSAARLTRVRLTPSVTGLASDGDRLRKRGRTYFVFSPGGSFDGSSVTYAVPAGARLTVNAAWLETPSSSQDFTLDEQRYADARSSMSDYWQRRLLHGATIVVPEQRVLDAERSLLIQELGLTWRYSIGNQYEEFFTPEGIDVARVMAEYGHAEVSRAILHRALHKRPAYAGSRPVQNPNWRMGARLVGVAQQARLSGDRSFVLGATPELRRYVEALGRQIVSSRRGLLRRERFSSNVAASVLGLHSQAIVWQGLRSMAAVWREMGDRELSARCDRLTRRLGAGLRRAIRASQRRLPDGSLFIPVRLLENERPFGTITASRDGTFWNLVMPYALASGLIRPESAEARGVLAYMLLHGSRLLGLVRAGAYPLYGTSLPTRSGSDQVYGLNVARFLADNDQPGQLVLSLYGQLAAAMAPGTFVSGEGASIAPLERARYRSMFLPPNGASNAAFLETLRLMLVHETTDRDGLPRGLQLAYATPRAWLRPGRRIEVQAMPTSFGRISYTIDSGEGGAFATIDVPDRTPLRSLELRLRLPSGSRISGVLLDGRPLRRFDPETGTIELPTRPGHLEVEADVAKS